METPNTRKNTPSHCHDCWKFSECEQAQNMVASSYVMSGVVDTETGDMYCDDHEPDGDLPVLEGEWDYPCHCCECGAALDHELTSEGVAYVKAAIADGDGCCRELWPVVWADYLS